MRLMALVAPVAVWQAAVQTMPAVPARLYAAIGGLGVEPAIPALLPMIAMGLYWVTAFSWYSRILELQADLFASGLERDIPSSAADRLKRAAVFVAALQTLASCSGDRRGGGLLHPGLSRRVRFIRQMLHDPRAAERFHCGVRMIGMALAATVLASLVLLVLAQPT
jgi:Zn-dependent protease with chaperone function